ncbi:MAG TPA: HAD family hydrolase, partial [Clostridiales bacterium]|nr:HAD family hydrolase [Clostridiales bacterium]
AHATVARTMGLVIIFLSNIFLVQVNSSHTDFAFQSLKRLVLDKIMWAITVGTFFALILMLYTPVAGFLKLAPLSFLQFVFTFVIAFFAV